jgi:hypothetical protein
MPFGFVPERRSASSEYTFSDVTLEFVLQDGEVKGLKQKDPSGELIFPKK